MRLFTPTAKVPLIAKPTFQLPDITIKFKWYQVPFQYVDATGTDGSFIRGMVGRINQKSWRGWAAGSLRYDHFTVLRRYTNPNPFPSAPGGLNECPVNYSNYYDLCDLEFTFTHTNRRKAPASTVIPTNGNYIALGHNLAPNAKDLEYYYAAVDNGTASGGRPTFLSAPFELLFTNPLAENNGINANWPQIRG